MHTLPQEPETLAEMRKRFPLALAEIIDVATVAKNPFLAANKNRKHIFDFADGMRMIASIDRIGKEVFVHISVSGNQHYAESIHGSKDEFGEDFWLRLSALIDHLPPPVIKCFNSPDGVLHFFFNPQPFGVVIADKA
jgi:hypothetical protein